MLTPEAQDAVLCGVTLALPDLPEPEAPADGEEATEPPPPRTYEVYVGGGDGDSNAADTNAVSMRSIGGGKYEAVRPIKGSIGPQACVRVREVGSPSSLFVSAPLAELGIGSEGGKFEGQLDEAALPADASAAEAGAPEGAEATLSCGWRVQRTLPPLVDETTKFRTRGLALRYAAPDYRRQFAERLDEWRLELRENRESAVYEPAQWTKAWRPPYPPHHLLGDPLTRRRRAEYITSAAAHASLFSAQAVAVQLRRLQDELPVCQTAEQAVHALSAVRDFVEHADHLAQIDSAQLLKQVRGLRLPFERLVRNVWEEGPEVVYDRTKASLQRFLAKEVSRRKALGLPKEGTGSVAAALKAGSPGGADLSREAVWKAESENDASAAIMAQRAAERPPLGGKDLKYGGTGAVTGTRLGLLAFHGKHAHKATKGSLAAH